jgi:histidine kinase
VTLNKSNGFFVSGKFYYARNEPCYSALVDAPFTDLCDLVAQRRGRSCRKITEALKDEIAVLSRVIPNISRVTGPVLGGEVEIHSNGKECFTRFKLSCRKFLNAIASKKHHVVLQLDDLQWADKESMEVIQLLVTDKV